jgi:hypothetical protein
MGLVDAFLRPRLKGYLTPIQQEKLIKYQAFHLRWLQHIVYRMLIGRNLRALATVYHTDKWNCHWYAQHYETHFAPLQQKPLTILEIGVGGEADPQGGGGSLRMWRAYFPKGRIYGIDLFDKSLHDERRIKTFRGSQVDEEFLDKVAGEIGRPDIVIDDGSHRNEHVIKTFHKVFPLLSDTGIYVVEDTQTSYWPGPLGGSSEDLNSQNTSMGFLKSLVDGLNYQDFARPGYTPSYFAKHVVAMHFYHNLVFVYKGMNDENGLPRRRAQGAEQLSVVHEVRAQELGHRDRPLCVADVGEHLVSQEGGEGGRGEGQKSHREAPSRVIS